MVNGFILNLEIEQMFQLIISFLLLKWLKILQCLEKDSKFRFVEKGYGENKALIFPTYLINLYEGISLWRKILL